MNGLTKLLLVTLVGLVFIFWGLPKLKKLMLTANPVNMVRDLQIKQIKKTIKEMEIRKEELYDY